MKKHLLFLPALIAITACTGGSNQWTLEGNVPPQQSALLLEAPAVDGTWTVVDSVSASKGRFTLQRKRNDGTIYRLKLDGRYIYIPSDSIETVTLTVDGNGGHSLGGSRQAELFTAIDRLNPSASGYVRNLLMALDGEYGSLAGYYATLRHPDRKLLRAVANAYATSKPSDSHTSILLGRLRAQHPAATADSVQQVVIEAPSIGYFDISLPDSHGHSVTLSSVVEANAMTLLVFNDFMSEASTLLQVALASAIDSSQGLAVYEVGFAPDQHRWLEYTDELPWTNVYQAEAANDVHLGQYMVTGLPAAFLISGGEVTKRFTSIEELTKHFKR